MTHPHLTSPASLRLGFQVPGPKTQVCDPRSKVTTTHPHLTSPLKGEGLISNYFAGFLELQDLFHQMLSRKTPISVPTVFKRRSPAEELLEGMKAWRISMVRLVLNPKETTTKKTVRAVEPGRIQNKRANPNPRGINPRRFMITSLR